MALDRLRPASLKQGGVCLGGLLVGLGLKLVSATRLRSHGWVAGCWAAGLRLELRLGGLCLGGSLDGQGLSHTHLGLGSELLAGLGLRPVADTQDTPAGGLRDGPEARLAYLETGPAG